MNHSKWVSNMAKKTEEFNFDDDSFWKELDEGSGSTGRFNDGSQKGGRRKAVTEFAGSFLSGVKNTLLDPSNQRKFLANNMPDGYAATFDAASMGVQGIKDIYRSTKDEFDKSLGDISKDAATLNKHYGKVLPKRLQDKINHKLENSGSGGTYRSPTEEENLNEDLNGIFAELTDVQRSAALANQQTTEATTNRIIASQNVNTAAVSVSNRVLSSIAGTNEKLVGINFTQGKLARKQIELTFKSFVIQRQMLDTLQQTKDMQEKAFKTLIQNTGLPEAVKVTNWELASKSLKQKMVGMATERMTASFAPTASLIFDRVKENFAGKAGMAGGGIGMIMSMLAMQADMGEFDERSGAARAGDMAGMAGGNALQWYLRKKLGNKFKDDPRFKRFGDGAMNFMDSFPGTFNNLQNNYGAFSQFMNMLGVGDILTPDSALKTRVRGSAHKHFDEVVSFNKKSELALTEVIPGWLGKVHHQLKIMASGDQNAEEERYDYEKAGFITKSELADRTAKSMYKKGDLKDSKAKAHRIVNSLDKNNELGKKEREVLMRYVLQQANSDTGFIDPAALMSADDSPLVKYDAKVAARVAEVLRNEHNFNHSATNYNASEDGSILFGNLNSDANYQARMRSSNDLLKELRYSMPKSKNVAIQQAGVGNIDILRDMGAITWDSNSREWRFNTDAMYDSILRGSGPAGSSGGNPNSPRPGGGSPYQPPSFGGGSPSPSPMGGGGGTGGGSPFGSTESYEGGYTPFQQELLETLERTSSRSSSDVGNQLLEAIRQRLEMGIPQGGEAAPVQQQDRKANWFRRMMTGSMQATGKGLKSYFKFATTTAPTAVFRAFVQTPMRIVRGVMDIPSRVLGFGRGKLSVIDSNSKKFGKAMGDLYVRGKESAVIKMADLKAGNYFDATSKKVIKSFKDIKGAIVDKDGNVVITEEEVKNGLYTIVNGKTFSIIGGALRAGLSAVTGMFKMNMAGLNGVTGIAKAGFGMAKSVVGFMMGAKDVYVLGETTPRLLARIMRAGGYFNKDGSPIKSVNDIRGDVVDSAGEVVLSTADIAKGLVDKRGKPFKSVAERVRNLLLAPVKAVVGIAKKALKITTLPFKILGKGAKSLMSLFSSKKDSTASDVLQAGSLDTLNKIYGLLDERMPQRKGSWFDQDGSGFRDGSREDVLSRRGEAKEESDKPKDDDDKKDRKGIIGLLMGIAGGIGGLIGTVKGWAKNIFALMRLATQTKLAGSAMDMLGGLMGGRGGRGGGRAGKIAGLFRSAKNFITKTKAGKILTAGAIVAGTIGFSKSSWGSEAIRGAAGAINSSGADAEKEAMSAGDMGAPPTSGGGSVNENNAPKDGPSMMQRILTGAGGGIMGEMAAIAAFPAMAALYQKAQGTKLGGKVLPKFTEGAKSTAPTTKTGKLVEFLTKSTKGRLIAAGLLGGGIVGGQNLMFGNGGEDLGTETTSSMRNTLLLDLAMATAAPLAMVKGKQWYDRRKAAKAAANMPHYNPVNVAQPGTSGVFRPGVNPTMGRAPLVGPTMPPTGIGPMMPASAAGAAGAIPAAVAPAAKAGIGSKLLGAGKGVFRNAGLLGTGFAAYDALTTEGTMWDKTKAFGSSLLTTAAIGKGMSMGGQLFSAVGRQALMQGARTGAVALASTLGAPVVLGALAVAAAGYAAWKGYKYFFGTDKNAVTRFRLAQYGVDIDDKEKATVIGQFEQLCQKNAIVDKSGKARFNKNVSATEIFKLFGIAEGDEKRIKDFITWFNGRFKPVFLTAFAFYQGKMKKTTLEKADEMPKADKLAMLNAMGSAPGNPASVMVSPFPDGKKLKYDEGDVKSELKKALRNVGNEKGPGDKSLTEKARDALSKGWDDTKKFVSSAWDKTKDIGGKVVDMHVNAAKAVGNLALKAAGGVGAAAGFVWGGVKGAYSTVSKTMGAAFKDTVGGAGFFKGTGGSAGDLPKPSGKGWKAVKGTILGAAKMVGVDPVLMIAIAAVESGFDPSAKAGTSSAAGLFQFISSTWNAMVSKYGQTYGIPSGTSALDGRANAILGACYIRDNAQVIKKIKGSVSATDVYMAHFLGSGGVKTFLTAMMKNPNASAPAVMPAAAKVNKTIFYNGGRARTCAEVYSLMQNKLATRAKQFGVEPEYLNGIGGTADSGNGAAQGKGIPYKDAGQTAGGQGGAVNNNTGGGSGGGSGFSMGGGGWFGYMMGGGGGIKASETEGGGYGGGTDLVAAAKSGAVVTSGKAADFIKSLDPKLIALGQKHTKVADKGVDLAGMVKGFMVIFYAMIGEAVTRGVLPGGVMVNSANRSIEKQKQLYDAYIRDPKRNPMAAKPGSSRHNYGIAIDINSGHANTLASANLLGKYGFTRPLLNHPRKPEAWHLESEYFKRGSGDTVTEVAKATKDSGDKSKVDKATKDQAKSNPIVKAENQTKALPPTIARPKTAEENLKSLSSGFMGGGSTWGGLDRSTTTPVTTPTAPTSQYLSKATNSFTSTTSAAATQQQKRVEIENTSQAMLNVQTQQLQVQQEMVGILHEIRDTLQSTGIQDGNTTQEVAPPPANSSANRAAEMIRAKSRDIPVSMSVNR